MPCIQPNKLGEQGGGVGRGGRDSGKVVQKDNAAPLASQALHLAAMGTAHVGLSTRWVPPLWEEIPVLAGVPLCTLLSSRELAGAWALNSVETPTAPSARSGLCSFVSRPRGWRLETRWP